nr:multidrug resistance-associated protein 5 [Tanacetum cinerariifolium]
MIPGTDLHCFVHNDGYFSYLPLTYIDGVILEMAIRRMPYEEFAVYLKEKYGSFRVLSESITNEMNACVFKKIGPLKKRYCNKFSIDEMVDWAEMESSTTDKGKKKVSKDAAEVIETRISIIEIDSETEIKVNREVKAKAKDNPASEINEPNDENSMSADNVRGKTFEEHDIYMNELFKSLNNADKDGITENPFIFVGENYVNVAQFKECLTYYALANGFSLWYERSGEVRVVAKCRQRPPRLSDLEKEDEHTYVRNFNFGSLVNYKWISKVFGDKIRANLDIMLYDIADLVMKKYKCKVSPNQCTNAKKYALTEYEKTIGEHYFMLRSYGKAILDSNPGSTVKLGVTVNPDGKTYFDR